MSESDPPLAPTIVSTTGGLWAALKAAQPGDTILLVPGSYSALNIAGFNPAAAVTITSLDPANPATIAGMTVSSSSNLVLSNLDITPQTQGGFGVLLYGDANIDLTHLNLHASTAVDGNAVMIRNSQNVTVESSEIHHISAGISFVNSDTVLLTNNTLHDIRSDGMHGGGTSNITISNNTFTDFFPKAGDHPDAIQFWTTGSVSSAHDIVITGNQMTRGAGGTFQGVFMGADSKLPFVNVTITNNAIVGGMYNGIAVQGGNNVTIEHNLVQGYSDMVSWIYVNDTINSSIDSNQITSINIGRDNVNLSNYDNLTIMLQGVGDLTALDHFLHPDPPAAAALPTDIVVDTGFPYSMDGGFAFGWY